MMVETFLNGLPEKESSALRLMATDKECSSVDAMAKRASRCSTRQKQLQKEINAIRGDLETLENQWEGMETDQ
mgnify:CR=1 FL=1